MRVHLLCVAACVLLLCGLAASAYPSLNVPVNWGDVPATEPVARNLDSPTLGECVCDTTRGLCDPHCCCDPDCSQADIGLFTYCLPETYSTPDIEYCYAPNSATTIKRINNIQTVVLDKQKQAHEAICVIRANHPSSLYRYFAIPTDIAKPNVELLVTDWPTDNESTYEVGGPVPVLKYVEVGGQPVYRAAGAFSLPTMTPYGGCSTEGTNVAFMDPIQGISCALNGRQICESFPISRFENIFVVPPNSTGAAAERTPVGVRVETLVGTVLEFVDPSVLPSTATYVSTNDGAYCRNAVLSMKVVFRYNAAQARNKITSANITLQIADVPVDTFVPLLFQSTFVAVGKSVPSTVISGTPGYVTGDRVRAGSPAASGALDAISEQASGFALPSGSRSCAFGIRRQVGFMHSVLNSGCTLLTTEAELEQMCTSGSTDHVLSLFQINGSTIYVATTNDALANDTSSWIAIQGLSTLAAVPGSYDAVKRRCDNMLTGLNFQFVIARAGVEYNPQDIIVAAFAEPLYAPWRIDNNTDYTQSATSLQQLTFQTTFTRYDPKSQATRRSRVVAPPILPRLDSSIFYPFRKPYPL